MKSLQASACVSKNTDSQDTVTWNSGAMPAGRPSHAERPALGTPVEALPELPAGQQREGAIVNGHSVKPSDD